MFFSVLSVQGSHLNSLSQLISVEIQECILKKKKKRKKESYMVFALKLSDKIALANSVDTDQGVHCLPLH